MWGDLTDITLALHAVLLIVLGIMILRSAIGKHGSRWWRSWPPAVLVLWGVSELTDGAVYFRRWIARDTGLEFVQYETGFSFALNALSMLAIALLIWRLWRGDMEDNEEPRPKIWPPEGHPRV